MHLRGDSANDDICRSDISEEEKGTRKSWPNIHAPPSLINGCIKRSDILWAVVPVQAFFIPEVLASITLGDDQIYIKGVSSLWILFSAVTSITVYSKLVGS